MRSDRPQDRIIPLTGQLSVAVRDWEIRLVLLSHEDIRDVDALAALDGQQVRVMLLPPERSDPAVPDAYPNPMALRGRP